jgi:tetratricopeptide (TPR) repeat protein
MHSPYFKFVSLYICALAIGSRITAAPQQGGFNHGVLMDTTGSMATLNPPAAPMFASGRVLLEDGTAPSEPVVIELVCNSKPYPVGYTDQKGRFSVQLGLDQGVIPSASMDMSNAFHGGPAGSPTGLVRESELRNCDLRASLPGFRSDVVYLSGRHGMEDPEMGTIVLHRLANVEGFTISATSLLAPAQAQKAFEKGMANLRRKKLEDARKDFEKATGVYPKYAAAWFELGMIEEQGDHADQARLAYAHALAADPKYINPYLRLCVIAYQEQKWQELADASSHVVHLNPYDFASAQYLNAVANLELNNLRAAERSAREVIKLDTAHRQPKVHYLLGLVLVRQRRFPEAAESLRVFLAGVSDAAQAEKVRKEIAEIEQLAKETARHDLQQPGAPEPPAGATLQP